MSRSESDVIIVGGGIMGASVALFLRRRGHAVTLLEREMLGRQASGTNFGAVRTQARALHQLPLSNRSNELWGKLPQLINHDVEFVRSGLIRVCYRDEQADALEAYATDARRYGLQIEALRGSALKSRFPFLGSEVVAATYSPTDGHANPRLAAPAIGRHASRLGAEILENIEIVAVEKDGREFRAISSDGREFRAPVMVIAAGAWSGILSEQFGEPVPIIAQGPQLGVTEPVRYGIRPVVSVASALLTEGVYFRQTERGNVVFGGGSRVPLDVGVRRASVLPQNTMQQFSQLRRLAPQLARLSIIRVWSGVEGYLPDTDPVIGASAKVAGLYYAFGFSGQGFQLGPGVGDALAELIDTGISSTPLEPFNICRFSTPNTDVNSASR